MNKNVPLQEGEQQSHLPKSNHKNNIDASYQILQVIPCHEQDVRAVYPLPAGSVLTGSRDLTAKLFRPETTENILSELKEVQRFTGPTEFVASVCCGKTKNGEFEVYLGSNDHNVYVYSLNESRPKEILKRHSDTVSSLAFRVINNQDVLVSGGWDSVAVIWRDKLAETTLYGHVNAIWSIAFVARSFILTAGADKTIRKWDAVNSQLLHIFDGHTDCVRGLAVITGTQFLSCSNDMTINLWHIDGNCMKTFSGHKHFVYDVCVLREPLSLEQPAPDSNSPPAPLNRKFKFISVSEDKTVKIWDKETGLQQDIPLQATTLWSVAALDNANFVVGTSDGHAYVFSQSPLQ